MFRALEAHSNKNFFLAIQVYAQILQMTLEPRIRSLIHNHRGMALVAMSEYQQAIDDFDNAVLYDAQNIRAWCNRGLTCRILGLHDLSLQHYQHALEIDRNFPEAFWGRARTYYEMQLFAEARKDCEQLLSLQEDFSPAQELLMEIDRHGA